MINNLYKHINIKVENIFQDIIFKKKSYIGVNEYGKVCGSLFKTQKIGNSRICDSEILSSALKKWICSENCYDLTEELS